MNKDRYYVRAWGPLDQKAKYQIVDEKTGIPYETLDTRSAADAVCKLLNAANKGD